MLYHIRIGIYAPHLVDKSKWVSMAFIIQFFSLLFSFLKDIFKVTSIALVDFIYFILLKYAVPFRSRE